MSQFSFECFDWTGLTYIYVHEHVRLYILELFLHRYAIAGILDLSKLLSIRITIGLRKPGQWELTRGPTDEK